MLIEYEEADRHYLDLVRTVYKEKSYVHIVSELLLELCSIEWTLFFLRKIVAGLPKN